MSGPKFLLLGKNGQLGWELQRALAPLGDVIALGRDEADLADTDSLSAQVEALRPQVIVNAAAYTAVDKAEAEEPLAQAINGDAPAHLAQLAHKLGARLIHYSTDYVFAGDKAEPYTEADTPAPLSAYGRSKLAGEQAVLAASPRNFVFRTCWVYGRHGGNFVKTILRLAKEKDALRVVHDQVGAPTPAALIADITAQVLGQVLRRPGEVPAGGLYHLAAGGETSWHGFATEIVREARRLGLEAKLMAEAIAAIPASGYPLPAPRPANSRLDCAKLSTIFNLNLPPWQTFLAPILADILTP
ncbi:MAG: dTDP-4-dehydrorhamnose reductase [Rhodocyclaceae bacterium]|nr:MAG: dTDP-4-dehydrorhamnose reductase [Rhodocyclaceae bacterium]